MFRSILRRRWLGAALVGIGLMASACGAGAVTAPVSEQASAAGAAADENIDNLQESNNPLDTEVLNVADGSISTLRSAVDGDRPVLVWFYSPH